MIEFVALPACAAEAVDKSSFVDGSVVMLDTMKPRVALYVGALCATGPRRWTRQ